MVIRWGDSVNDLISGPVLLMQIQDDKDRRMEMDMCKRIGDAERQINEE